nr:immunoglobulin light chain junction region [Macaca mulatta]
CMLPLEFPWTF